MQSREEQAVISQYGKNMVLRCGNQILRVLEEKDAQILVIDCGKQTVPRWMSVDNIRESSPIEESLMLEETGMVLQELEQYDAASRRLIQERYTMIAGILPFAGDKKIRNQLVRQAAEERGISTKTVTNYLCRYLVYQDLSVLAPKQKQEKRELTGDEKNIRWALNRYYYSRHKHSLTTAYTMMLKEKYCDASGILLPEYPSIHQFKYYYRKHKSMQTYYISRDGLKSYQRNHRPLTGDGVQEFAPNVGVGMLDATVCDIYLVNEAGNLVGRPILVACIDAYSSLCCGYSLLWEGGVYSLRNLLLHVIADKVEWCRRFGIGIRKEQWNSDQMPAVLVTDMGSEYKSENFEQIAELGVTVINLPSYRPELKGSVEKFFDLIQESYKKHLKGKGVIEPDYQERGARDYRKDACLTMNDFEKVILHCILYYNCKRIVENFPYTEEMLKMNIQPFACQIYAWGKKQAGANLISMNRKELVLTLLPRTVGKFSRFGLKVNRMRYHCDGFTEQYLKGGSVTVAYNPDDVSVVWVLDKGSYIAFELIESRFQGKSLTDVQSLQDCQKAIVKEAFSENLQAQINLAEHIETIAHNLCGSSDVHMKNIRNTRKQEQRKRHVDSMKEGVSHEDF